MSMLSLTAWALLQGATPQPAPVVAPVAPHQGPNQTTGRSPSQAAIEAALWGLLDTNADGQLDRYEAAAAAMAWVDDAAAASSPAGAAPVKNPTIAASAALDYLRVIAAEYDAEAAFFIENFDDDGDAHLSAEELPPTLTELAAFDENGLLPASGFSAAALVEASAQADPDIMPVWEGLSQIAYADTNGDGYLTIDEAGEHPRVGIWPFADVDSDGDGRVTASEAALMDVDIRADEVESAAQAWFTDLDLDASGTLDDPELKGTFERQSWRLFDLSADRRLTPDEFIPLTAASELPASFTVDGTVATMRGTIDGSTPGRFLEVLLEHRGVDELVLEFVPGSMNHEANIVLLNLLHTSGITARVPRTGSIASGATDLLLAAKKRIVDHGALVGIHSWAGNGVEGRDLPKDDEAHGFYLNYLSAVDVDPEFYWRTLEAAPADGMHWMTEDEIHRYGLRTETQGLTIFHTGTNASLRGLAAVTSEIAWATGSGATVLKTKDAGRTWANVAPASIHGLDVRDVYALSADVAWIMTAGPGESSRILYTENGGGTWVEQYRETSPRAFLDGLDAWDGNTLIAYGDPMEDGRFRVLLSDDGGETWTPSTTGPLALESGEASFAASGTGLRTIDALRAWIVTGGTKDKARAFWTEDRGLTWTPVVTPIAAEGAGAGAFSVSFREDGTGVIVGGDFMNRPAGGIANAAYSEDFGKTWHSPDKGPRGQRAGSVALGNGWFLATGQTGTDVSRDGGRTWLPFSSEGFHCVDAALIDGTIWLAGPKGRVARVQ